MTLAHVARRLVFEARLRRLVYLVVGLILLVFCFFPRPYVARAKILPQENGSAAGLGSMVDVLGGRLNGTGSFLTDRSSVEAYLVIGRSNEVAREVVKRLDLAGPGRRYATEASALRSLNRKVDVHALLGGTLEVETFAHDSDEALTLNSAFLDAVNHRINLLSRNQVSAKRALVRTRFAEAAARVGETEQALNAFRQRNRLADPTALFGAAVSERAGLEANLQAKLVELNALRSLFGADNIRLQETEAQIQALRQQIAETNKAREDSTGLNLAAQTRLTNQYLNLYRDYRFAQSLFDIYSRFSEQVELQELASQSGADIQVIEEPHLDVQRHYNVLAVGLLAAWLTLILFLEVYAPATGMHLPSRRFDTGA